VTALLVVAALRQGIARVGGGHKRVEVGGIIRQQAGTDHLVVLPQGQQAQLSSIQIILDIDRGAQGMELDLIKAIPERL
jgi:hypothetical protein